MLGESMKDDDDDVTRFGTAGAGSGALAAAALTVTGASRPTRGHPAI